MQLTHFIRFAVFFLIAVGHTLCTFGQKDNTDIQTMRWDSDYQLHVSLNNNSNYVVDVRGLFHETDKAANAGVSKVRYWPVALDKDFLHHLKSKPLTFEGISEDDEQNMDSVNHQTLWSSLHNHIGGGYVHLLNCIVYALESGYLTLEHPLMQRPISKWRPNPMTKSYKRTRKWRYYVPTQQKDAHKEYALRKKEDALGDLLGIPPSFVSLFLQTKEKGYQKLQKQGKRTELAQIDLVKIMLGARYLSEKPIKYISQCVKNAITTYTVNNMPSVIIFDDYHAAVAMRLDQKGYRIDYIVFQNQETLPQEEIARRERVIRQLVQNINEANAEVFRSRLRTYYD